MFLLKMKNFDSDLDSRDAVGLYSECSPANQRREGQEETPDPSPHYHTLDYQAAVG